MTTPATPAQAAAAILDDLHTGPLDMRVISDCEFPSRVTLEVVGNFNDAAVARDRIAQMRRDGRLGTLAIKRYPSEEVRPGEHLDRFEISRAEIVEP